jgi:molecular chaperone DnaK
VPAELKTRLDQAVERARKAHRGEDFTEIKAALEELNAAFQAAGRSFYEQQQQPPSDASQPATDAPEAGKKDDGVADADYEIVDDSKKS